MMAFQFSTAPLRLDHAVHWSLPDGIPAWLSRIFGTARRDALTSSMPSLRAYSDYRRPPLVVSMDRPLTPSDVPRISGWHMGRDLIPK
jgi:hypothetical protein